jgi:tetratricopeptide (TPR) repeat protein
LNEWQGGAQPKDAEAWNYHNLGVSSLKAGRPDEALRWFEREMESRMSFPNPRDWDSHIHDALAWTNLAESFYRMGEWDNAHQAAKKAIATLSDKGPTLQIGSRWWYYTMTLIQLGEREKARSHYDELAAELRKQRGPNETDSRLRAEVAKLLGIEVESDADQESKSMITQGADDG